MPFTGLSAVTSLAFFISIPVGAFYNKRKMPCGTRKLVSPLSAGWRLSILQQHVSAVVFMELNFIGNLHVEKKKSN
jgi:hypothetical protein